ncbi:putative short-chain dehydrogenase/reductase SDR [Magnetofaba australis IT-1]|uniref:Putative short-chain dehydrogenase/reductase SDR n=1 Tax=Magnetofaba australis IT-1 TaxID=1434232 RepID=A0A1Y2K5R7_9PROT|nr:putative short-chain dehydrogenase/reductase SDR [Magnetofaba australis IT-1]
MRLGRALALSLAQRGYDVMIHYNSSVAQRDDTLQELAACGVDSHALQADLSDVAAIPELLRRAKQAMPHLGVLINSASAYQHASIMQTDAALFDQQFAVNLRAPFFLTQAFARTCGQGCVINILDNKINYNQFEYAAYLLAKKSLAEFTKMAAMELAPALRVNGVAPGVVLPAETRSEAYVKWRIEGIPLKRQGETDHIAQAMHYLLENPFVTGQALVVDGGESIQHIGRHFRNYE